MKRRPKKPETSKLLLLYALTINTAMIVFGCYMAVKTCDTAIIVTVISGSAGDLGVCYGFYYWKAKCENVVKYAKDNGVPLTEGIVSTLGTITGGS